MKPAAPVTRTRTVVASERLAADQVPDVDHLGGIDAQVAVLAVRHSQPDSRRYSRLQLWYVP